MAEIFALVDDLKFVQDVWENVPRPTTEYVVQIHLKGLLIVLLHRS